MQVDGVTELVFRALRRRRARRRLTIAGLPSVVRDAVECIGLGFVHFFNVFEAFILRAGVRYALFDGASGVGRGGSRVQVVAEAVVEPWSMEP
eukprot:5184692-Pleurochrysis_carterae.AAC.1